MNKITLQHPSGARAEVLPYGAHVISWKTADGNEHLFLSDRAEFRSGVAIRGGVPIIFPQFAALGSLPKHGFARTSDWCFIDTPGKNSASFELGHSPQTLQVWPFKFAMNFKVILEAESLRMQLTIKNEDVQPFSFTAALHTYLRVSDIEAVTIRGLKDIAYRDSTQNGVEAMEHNDALKIAGEVDRVYMSTASPIQVIDADQMLLCSMNGFRDTVIWNPGQLLSAKLPDMRDDGYRHMLCVEAGAIASPIHLAPAEQWQGEQNLQATISSGDPIQTVFL